MTTSIPTLIERIMDGPLTGGRLDDDLYNLTMGQAFFKFLPDVGVQYGFTNRHAHFAPLANELDLNELGDALDDLQQERFTDAELAYLASLPLTDDRRLFTDAYLSFLRDSQRPAYHLDVVEGRLRLTFSGPVSTGVFWEVPALSTISGLRTRHALRQMSRFEREATIAEGISRLRAKIRAIRAHDHPRFVSFATRRRAALSWQLYLEKVLADELPGQFLGTSCVYSAMFNGIKPVGTNAHQWAMVHAALTSFEEDPDAALRDVHQTIYGRWWDLYGESLAIALPDTYGTEAGLKDFTPEMLRQWRGFREDSSGNPIAYGQRLIALYERHGIDPSTKVFIPSDGLTTDTMIAISDFFQGRMQVISGVGTHLGNDLGLATRSIVVKPWQVWRLDAPTRRADCAKLSDNIAKAVGSKEEIERCRRVFDYRGNYAELPDV